MATAREWGTGDDVASLWQSGGELVEFPLEPDLMHFLLMDNKYGRGKTVSNY
jgi:hypothetical protein